MALLVNVDRLHACTALVCVRGEMDQDTVTDLNVVVERCFADSFTTVLLDLGDVPLCDSAGLGALVLADRAARALGSRVHLVEVGPALPRLLQLTGLDQVLSVRPDLAVVTRSSGPQQVSDPGPEAGQGPDDQDTMVVVLADSTVPLVTSERPRALVESHEAGKRARRQAVEAARAKAARALVGPVKG
jgi:anti-sigma B factor antagonist